MASTAAAPAPADAPRASYFRIPAPIARLFATFPLYTYEPAQVLDPALLAPLSRPLLYVAPGHPRRGQAANADGVVPRGWASSDVRSLRWQMEMVLRKANAEFEQITEDEAWGPEGSLPYLRLPHGLLGESSLQSWITSNAPLAHEKPEDGDWAEKQARGPWRDDEQAAEARAWSALLETDIMAGVLLQQALTPQPAGPKRPFLSAPLHANVRARRLRSLRSAVAHLAPLEATSAIPGYNFSLAGLLGGNQVLATGTAEEAQDEPEPEIDVPRVFARAVVGIEALGTRMEEDGAEKWFLGAESATPMDALVFSLLHTILSLPVPDGQSTRSDSEEKPSTDSPQCLRAAVERSPALLAWTRRVWQLEVRPRGG